MTRKWAGIAAVAAGALLFAGCTASDGSGSDDSTVTVWGPWSGKDGEYAQRMIDAYNDSQDAYTVEYQPQEDITSKVLTALASGANVPDVVIWDRYQTSLYASKGSLTRVDDLVAGSGIDTGDFYDAALQEMTYDDGLYGLPLIVDNRALFYNKTMFDEAGIAPPTTWDELEAAAKALTVRDEGGKLVQAGFELKDPGLFNFWCFQAGCDLVTEDQSATAYDSAEGESVLAFWDRLLTGGEVYEAGFSDDGDPFAEGRLAMKYDGPWALAGLDEVEDLDYGIVEPVAGPNGDKGAVMGGLGLVTPQGAGNTEGAWDFMTWWAADPAQGVEFARLSGWPPANEVAARDPFFDSEEYAAFIAAMDYARTRPTVAGFSDVEKLALTPQIELFMNGEVSAEEALTTARIEGDEILAKEAK